MRPRGVIPMAKNESNIFKLSLITIALFTAGMSAAVVSAADRSVQESKLKPISASEHYAQLESVEKDKDKNDKEKSDDEKESAALDENGGETVIVTGYRGSLIRSLDEKRNADTVTEQVTADDLGSLPDVSIADALTRLPGISAIRTGGKASEINIRGLSGLFVHTTLNGREQVSTSGSRSVEFSQYPSELISGATVYKSQKASLIEGGVAGTVDLKTASPLSNREQHSFSINLRGMYNDRADEIYDAESNGSRISFSYQGKFADDTLGVALGFARLDQPSVATQFIGFAYNGARDLDGLPNDTDGPEDNPANEYLSEGFEMQHKGGTSIRDGYVGVVEWAPSNTFAMKADVFISKFDEKAFARGFRVKFDPTTANILNPVFDGNAMIGGTVNRTGLSNNNTRVELVNDNNVKQDDVFNYGLNAEWQLTDQFSLIGDISRSSATSDFRNGLLWGLVAEDANAANPVVDNNVSIAYQLNGLNLPDVGFNQNFTDLNRVMISKYGVYPYQFKDALNAIKFDGTYETRGNETFSSFQAGIRYSERQYQNRRSVFEYGSDSRFSTNEPPLQLNSSWATPVGFGGDFSNFPNYLAVDFNATLAAWFPNGVPQPVTTWGADENGVINNSSDWSVKQSGNVWEDVFSGYFVANIDTEIGGTPVTGNLGLRVVRTEQSATSLEDVAGDVSLGAQNIIDDVGLVNDQYAPTVKGISYTDYLPQINLNFGITENSQLRFGAARVMSRSPINRLASNSSGLVNDDGVYNAWSTNSPFLKPFMADQYDLSYEYYFAESEGAFIAALFYKDIKTFVQEFTIANFDFAANGFAIPEYLPGTEPGNRNGPGGSELDQVPVTNGSYTTAVNNANGGYFAGVELAYTQIFTNLPELWSGLGISTSYAYTDSQIDAIVGLTTTTLGGPTEETSFPGLSEHVVNGAVFWDYLGFDTRLNVRYRSEFVSSQFAIDEQSTFFASEMVFDYQASYRFDNDLTLLFQVINLTDEPTRSYFGSETKTGTIQFFGRQYYLGLNYKF